jgi:hypothetical protein
MTKAARVAVLLMLSTMATPAAWPQTAPQVANGWDIYGSNARKIVCGDNPVLLNGSHTDVSLTGPCRYVRVAGAHNDVEVTIQPGGTIEITGAHNDVFWHPQQGATEKPILLDHGSSNDFHRRGEGDG